MVRCWGGFDPLMALPDNMAGGGQAMNTGKKLFAQLMDFLPWSTFDRIERLSRVSGYCRQIHLLGRVRCYRTKSRERVLCFV
jgi:hypothetical protein